MSNIDKTVIIHIDALLKDYDKNDPKNFLPPVKSGIKEFLEKIYEFYSDIHIYSDINSMVVQKILRDNNIDCINQIDLIEQDCCIYIGKNTVKFNDTSKEAMKFTSILNFTVDFLNKQD